MWGQGPGAKGAECGPWKVYMCLLHHLRRASALVRSAGRGAGKCQQQMVAYGRSINAVAVSFL